MDQHVVHADGVIGRRSASRGIPGFRSAKPDLFPGELCAVVIGTGARAQDNAAGLALQELCHDQGEQEEEYEKSVRPSQPDPNLVPISPRGPLPQAHVTDSTLPSPL